MEFSALETITIDKLGISVAGADLTSQLPVQRHLSAILSVLMRRWE